MHDNLADRRLGNLNVFFGNAVLVELPGDQVALRDAELFFLGIAGNLNNLHAVAQGGQNGVDQVGGRDKHHFRQVERNAQVMIGKGVVLFWVEHLKQGGRRIAPEVHPHFVDFVQHEHRIAGAGLLHALNHTSGQRSDIGPPMPADFRFVAYPRRD